MKEHFEMFIIFTARIIVTKVHYYRGADKSLAQPGRKHANVSVRIA